MAARVAAVSVAAIVAATIGLAQRSTGSEVAVTSRPATTTSSTAATTTSTTTPRRPATTSPPTSTTEVAETSTSTTVAPIVTHLAEIDVLRPREVAAPARVVISALGVDGPVLAAGVNGAGELDIPPDARTLVWYRHGPSPGDVGSAVIAGHLNWRGVSGLFADLATTPVGAAVSVVYDDGSTRDFTVTAVELVEKPAVSVSGVFARDGASVLRLVTCGGEFDASTRHYRSNVIVTAVPA
jgi:Sortase domain